MLTRGLLVLILVVACGGGSGDDEAPIVPGPGAETAEKAVTELVDHLDAAEFGQASDLAIPGHAALAALSEGATFAQVATALRSGDVAVAANFWSGFAQGTGSFLIGPVGFDLGGTVEREGVTWDIVGVRSPEGEEREMLVRDEEGYRVDLFASFGPGLAPRMIQPVERLLTTDTDDARHILAQLGNIVPSLLVASERPGLHPEAVQGILQLVELITRVG